MSLIIMPVIRSLEFRDSQLLILDQTRLPAELHYLEVDTVDILWEAIRALRVRGAPAIGVAASFGAWLAATQASGDTGDDLWPVVMRAHDHLRTSRPTAVNLFWALERVETSLEPLRNETARRFRDAALDAALAIMQENEQVCERIGEVGLELLHDGMTLLTHCNAGGLATVRVGTALAPIYAAVARGMRIEVIADETRPLLQGSRLTAWELTQAGIPTTVICDGAAAMVMRTRKVDGVIVGADRVAANGDVANKIGTYSLAVLAKAHAIPVYVAAPISTIDLDTASGDDIVIEERAAEEVLEPFGQPLGAPGAAAYNPAFDVTPADLVTALITERGIVRPLNRETLRLHMGEASSVA